MIDTEIASLLKQFYSVIRKHGISKIINRFSLLELYLVDDQQEDLAEFIVKKVIFAYSITEKELFEKKQGITSEARTMCYVLMKEHLGLSESKIGWYFDRHNKVVYRALAEYSKMTDKVSWQKDFLKKKAEISQSIEQINNKSLENNLFLKECTIKPKT